MRFYLIYLLLLLANPLYADSYQSWASKAAKAEKAGDKPAAVQAWSNALHLWKESDGKKAKAGALSSRAKLYESEGDVDAALKDLGAALKLDNKNAKLAHRRGVLLLERGDAQAALNDFYTATKLDLSFGQAFFDRGRAYEKLGDAGFAKEDYKAACELGVKAACQARKGKKPAVAKKAPAQNPPPPPAQAAAEAPAIEEESSDSLGKEIGKHESSASPACSKSIDRCAEEEGGRYESCAEKASNCPAACLRKFKKALNSQSEAQAFREVYESGRPCD